MAKWKDLNERGDFGAWLSAQMGDRTADWLAAEMAKRGHVHGASYYRAMAGGSKPPGRVIRRALMDFFGGGPPPEEETVPDLAAAITALTVELREWREDDRRRLDTLWDATVWLLRATRPPEEAPTSAERPPPLEVLERGGR